jgi:hypothetical protein
MSRPELINVIDIPKNTEGKFAALYLGKVIGPHGFIVWMVKKEVIGNQKGSCGRRIGRHEYSIGQCWRQLFTVIAPPKCSFDIGYSCGRSSMILHLQRALNNFGSSGNRVGDFGGS